jgi:hypothetical protein
MLGVARRIVWSAGRILRVYEGKCGKGGGPVIKNSNYLPNTGSLCGKMELIDPATISRLSEVCVYRLAAFPEVTRAEV